MFVQFTPRSPKDSPSLIKEPTNTIESEKELDHEEIYVDIDSPRIPRKSSAIKSCTKGLRALNASVGSRGFSSQTPQPADDNTLQPNPPVLSQIKPIDSDQSDEIGLKSKENSE